MTESFDKLPIDPSDSSLEDAIDRRRKRVSRLHRVWAMVTLLAFVSGSVAGFFVGANQRPTGEPRATIDANQIMRQVNPEDGYTIMIKTGTVGPQLIAAGAFRLQDFLKVYEQAGQPVTEAQLAILYGQSDAPIVFNSENSYFLLNFFWALGLANKNPVLETGPMMMNGPAGVTGFASTGGWSLAAIPVADLYSSTAIITLTPDQQRLVEEVAAAVYRPCCDNPTHFPDCNHGMAMLGLLQLMASQGATKNELFEAAKYATAYWFPKQSLELAIYFKATQDKDFAEIDARQFLSRQYASLSGYQKSRQWLGSNGYLPQVPGDRGSCGV